MNSNIKKMNTENTVISVYERYKEKYVEKM